MPVCVNLLRRKLLIDKKPAYASGTVAVTVFVSRRKVSYRKQIAR